MAKSSTVVGFLLLVVICVVSTCEGTSARSETQSQNVVNFHSMPKPQKEEAWCEMCELIMDRVKVLIKEKDSEGKVNSTLYNLCEIVKGAMRQQCFEMVPMLKYQLTHGFDSHHACLMLGFCGGGQAVSLVMDFIANLNGKGASTWKDLVPIFQSLHPHIMDWVNMYGLSKARAGFSVTCMMCKTAVGLVDSTLDQYKKPLVDYVVGICNDLPAPTNKACSDAMSFYIPAWWDAFFAKVASPEEVCTDLGMCKESSVDTQQQQQQQQPRVINA